jgi:hypothetical protein
MIIKYLLFIPISFLMYIQNFFTAPLVVLLSQSDEHGQSWLTSSWVWWQTPDNPLEGDEGYRTLHAPFKNPINFFQKYINKVFWLYRNPMYGFNISVLGQILPDDFKFYSFGNAHTSNRPLSKGIVLRLVYNNTDAWFFQLYIVIPYWKNSRCLRLNLGYKIWESPQPNQYCQYVCSLNPWMSTDISNSS